MSRDVVERRPREDRGRDDSVEVDTLLDLAVELRELIRELKALLLEIRENLQGG